MSKATKPFISGNISLRGQEALNDLLAGKLEEHQQSLAESFEARRQQKIECLTASNNFRDDTTSDF